MSRINFTRDEYLILAMYRADTRRETVERIREAMQYIGDDPEMKNQICSVLWKTGMMSDEEYRQLDLDPYEQDPVEEEKEEDDHEQSVFRRG